MNPIMIGVLIKIIDFEQLGQMVDLFEDAYHVMVMGDFQLIRVRLNLER